MPTTTTRSAEDMLNELMSETAKTTDRAKAKIADTSRASQQFEQLHAKIDKAVSIADERKRTSELRILTSNLEQLRELQAQTEQDLANAYFGMKGQLQQIGVRYEELNRFSASEQGGIDSANQALREAQDNLAVAKTKWNFFGRRDRAVVRATTAIAGAEQQIKEATEAAKESMRARIRNAKMDESLQNYAESSDRVVLIMEESRENAKTELERLKLRKNELADGRTEAARKMEELDAIIDQKSRALSEAREQLTGLNNGTPEYADQDAKIQRLTTEIEEFNGARNTALMKYETCENLGQQTALYETSVTKMRANLAIWITSLKTETAARRDLFHVRLEGMKLAADQEVAQMHSQLGAEIDRTGAEYMASIGAATDRMRAELFEDIPKRIEAIHAISVAQVKAHMQTEERMQKVFDDFKTRWGIDPLSTSFFVRPGEAAEKTQ